MSNDTPLAQIYDDIASAICGQKTRIFHFPKCWVRKIHVIEPTPGVRLVVEEKGDKEIFEIKLESVTNSIMAWLRNQIDPEILLTPHQAKEAAICWMAVAEPIPIEAIKSVRWRSEGGYTWRRLPWDMQDGETPTWDKILGKITNPSAFRQWLGSLFFDEAKQHQYVWVHGMGNDGKGCMNRFLRDVFGRAYRSKQPPAPGDKFWTYGLLGSRLVVFPDCNSQKFTTGGMFKSLSGGDPVDVEAKGRMSFTANLDCKFLFFSNEKPNISCEDADMRRIIYCEFFEKTKKEDADRFFEKKLWDEGGAFLTKCVKEYIENCPHHENIQSDKEVISDWVSTNDEQFQLYFDRFYKQPHEDYRTTKHLSGLTDEQLDLVTVEPAAFFAGISEAFPSQKDQAAFRDWLYKKYGVQKKSIRRGKAADGGRDIIVHRYIGMHRHPTTETAKKMYRDLEILRRKWRVVSTASTVDNLS